MSGDGEPVEPPREPVEPPREPVEPPREPRPIIERIGLAAVALVLAVLFGGVAAASGSAGALPRGHGRASVA